MTKRSLTDMLRAETQKAATEPELEATKTVAKAPATKTPTKETSVRAKSAAKVTPAATTDDAPQDLESLVRELNNALEASRDREHQLQQQVIDLQTELEASQTHVSQLKEYLEQANQLKAELDKVKKDNLQLAEVNIKLTEEAKAIAQNRAQLELKQAPQNAIQVSEPKRDREKEQAAHLTRILRRPIGSNAALSKVNDKNIGWFD